MIHLALTHDWELRGDGSGDIEQIQFAPLRKLLAIYEEHGTRTTFLPDVMQQLRFRSLQDKHPELRSLADLWDEHVRQTFRQRHDIQLHLHPHWLSAHFEGDQWQLAGDWAIVNYDRETARAMLCEAKEYLERLLRPIDDSYRCLAFRAGALAAAPSDHLLQTLAELELELDVSIAAGLWVDEPHLRLDYRDCEEPFLPYYPVMTDARRVSRKPEPIICVPLNHFLGSRHAVTRQNLSLVKQRLLPNQAQPLPSVASKSHNARTQNRARAAFDKLVKPLFKRKYFVSDTGRLDYALMREMLAAIRHRAKESGLENIPIVLTNHPKDIRDWNAIEKFVAEVSRAEDLRFITLSEVANKLRNGEFQVRRAS